MTHAAERRGLRGRERRPRAARDVEKIGPGRADGRGVPGDAPERGDGGPRLVLDLSAPVPVDVDVDWNWGGEIKNETRAAVAALRGVPRDAAPVCAAWADFFYVPRGAWAAFAAAEASALGRVSHEVAVATGVETRLARSK